MPMRSTSSRTPSRSNRATLAGSSDSPMWKRGWRPFSARITSRPRSASRAAMVEPAGPPPTTRTSQSKAAGEAEAGAGVAGGRDMIRCGVAVAAAATVRRRRRMPGEFYRRERWHPRRARRTADHARAPQRGRQRPELGQRLGRGAVRNERRMRARGDDLGQHRLDELPDHGDGDAGLRDRLAAGRERRRGRARPRASPAPRRAGRAPAPATTRAASPLDAGWSRRRSAPPSRTRPAPGRSGAGRAAPRACPSASGWPAAPPGARRTRGSGRSPSAPRRRRRPATAP